MGRGMVMILGGYALSLAGIGLMLWSAAVLGWARILWLSAEPKDPAQPRLVFAGPYGRVRHPFFLAILMILAGTAAVSGAAGFTGAFVLGLLFLPVLARREEREFVRQFGEAYRRYQQAVPLLLPAGRRAMRS